MDTRDYGRIVEQLITTYADQPVSDAQVRQEVVVDRDAGHYVLFTMGWQARQRVYYPEIHIELRGNKIWIQADRTEEGMGNLLVAAGVPKEHIVLAFYSESHRRQGEFAVS